MLIRRDKWMVSRILVVGIGLVAGTSASGGPPALVAPVGVGDGDVPPEPDVVDNVRPASSGLNHESMRASTDVGARVRAPSSPPKPLTENPSDDRPNDLAQWTGGYWAWDASRGDFAWVAGVWRIRPPGMIWVNGRWTRDAGGWSRVPGFWSPRQSRSLVDREPTPALVPTAPSGRVVGWRRYGPPANLPEDDPGVAPGPDAFFVPGHYSPSGNGVVWTPGFWARSRTGYEWLPARWVRRPDGWTFRNGSWAREAVADVAAAPVPIEPGRRPAPLVESEPADPGVNLEPLPLPAGDEPGLSPVNPRRDPIAEEESADRVVIDPRLRGPVVVAPMPYYGVPYAPIPGRRVYVYPPGFGPRAYDPLGVVPPFARRIIDRFVP